MSLWKFEKWVDSHSNYAEIEAGCPKIVSILLTSHLDSWVFLLNWHKNKDIFLGPYVFSKI